MRTSGGINITGPLNGASSIHEVSFFCYLATLLFDDKSKKQSRKIINIVMSHLVPLLNFSGWNTCN